MSFQNLTWAFIFGELLLLLKNIRKKNEFISFKRIYIYFDLCLVILFRFIIIKDSKWLLNLKYPVVKKVLRVDDDLKLWTRYWSHICKGWLHSMTFKNRDKINVKMGMFLSIVGIANVLTETSCNIALLQSSY